jgi:hypothetical protein
VFSPRWNNINAHYSKLRRRARLNPRGCFGHPSPSLLTKFVTFYLTGFVNRPSTPARPPVIEVWQHEKAAI